MLTRYDASWRPCRHSASSLVRADAGGFAGGSAPQRRHTVRRKPNDASEASQLRSIDQRGLRPTKKHDPGTPAVRLDRRSVESDDRRRIIHTQAQPKHNPSTTQAQPKHNPSTTLPSPIPNPPSILTLYASPVKSYGGCAGVVMFLWGRSPLWSIERSCDASLASFGFRRTVSRRWGAEPPYLIFK